MDRLLYLIYKPLFRINLSTVVMAVGIEIRNSNSARLILANLIISLYPLRNGGIHDFLKEINFLFKLFNLFVNIQ